MSPVADSAHALARELGRAALDRLPTSTRRRVQTWRGHPVPEVIQLDQLDERLEEARRLFDDSEEAARAFLDGFELAPPPGRPEDPFSGAYRQWVFDCYQMVSGRAEYTVDHERSPFDIAQAARRPFPYATASARLVGQELVARGLVLQALGLSPPARVVEFGPGWGNLTVDLAATGFEVTGVEIDPDFCELVVRRCLYPERLHMVRTDMLSFSSEKPFEAAVFYESFHHCADHLGMLERLHQLVRPDGVVLFCAEPIGPLPYPWGLRLDGLSLFSTRVHGWLELGFAANYFVQALARTGWRAERRRATGLSPLADVLVARVA